MSGPKQKQGLWTRVGLVAVVLGLVAGLIALLHAQGDGGPSGAASAVGGQGLCARATELILAGEPEAALDLIRLSAPLQGEDKVPFCKGEFEQALVATSVPDLTKPVPVWFAGLVGDRTTVPEVVVIALGLMLAFAVLTRLVIPWIPRWFRLLPESSQLVLVVGFVLLGAGSAVLAVTVTGTGGPGTWEAFWAGVVFAALGSVVVALGLATRLRVTIKCSGSDGAESVPLLGRVVAQLGELGSDPATGIEVTRGTDVDALEGSSFGNLPEGRVAKLLVGLAHALFATNPWQVLVDAQADGAYSVSVARNGRAVGAATVSRDLIKLPDDDAGKKAREHVDLVTLVAAFVLAALAKGYRGFEGLGGATDWLSIGLHAVATTDRDLAETHKRELLAQAVDHDGGNWPAQVALRHALWRDSTDAIELEQYLRWLDSTIASLSDAYPGLALRMRTTRALARVNHYYAAGGRAGGIPSELRADVCELTDALVEIPGSYRHLARETEPIAWSLVLLLEPAAALAALAAPVDGETFPQLMQKVLPEPPAGGAAGPAAPEPERIDLAAIDPEALRVAYREPLSAHASYAMGCTLATFAGADARFAKLPVPHLRVALALRELRDWIGKDPQLEAFTKTAEYRKALLKAPRKDIFELDEVGAYAKPLKAAGFTTVDRLRGVQADPLAAALAISAPTVAAIGELAQLRASMTDPVLRVYGIEVLAVLAEQDRASRRALAHLRHHAIARSRLAHDVRDEVLQRCRPVDQKGAPTTGVAAAAALESALTRWLWSVADDGARASARTDGHRVARRGQRLSATFNI